MSTIARTDSTESHASCLPLGRRTETTLRVAVFGRCGFDLELIRGLLASGDWCRCSPIETADAEAESFCRRFDVAVMVDRGGDGAVEDTVPEEHQEYQLELLRRQRIGVLILTARPWRFAGYGFGTVCLPREASVEKAHGVLLALSRSQPVMRLIDKQVDNIRRLSESLSRQFEETQGELRLAARLQRDFLPRELPQQGPLRFTTLFRPCGWVSGDIFDIFRLDETHWGFYLADAVGHGVAAGLLTMYLKNAIRPKRILQHSYELVGPAEVLGQLNEQLAAHDLHESQFITCWYGLIDTASLELRFAVAGHPPALWLRPSGEMTELHGDGCILGLGQDTEFEERSVRLAAGDRLILYSDGLEPTFIASRPPGLQLPQFNEGVTELLRSDANELIERLRSILDLAPGSLSRADDASMVVADVKTVSSQRPPAVNVPQGLSQRAP